MNCANVSRNDLRWDILYPRQSGFWPAVLAEPGRYGTYDPGTKSVREVDPYRDDELPALRGWLTRGELVAYRPRRRATVRIVSTAGNRYVKVVRPAKAHKMERLFTDVLGASPAASVTSPQLPQLTYSHPSKGFVVLTEVVGDSLHELAPDPGSRILAAVGGAVARFHSLSTSGVRERRDSGRPNRWVKWVEATTQVKTPSSEKNCAGPPAIWPPFGRRTRFSSMATSTTRTSSWTAGRLVLSTWTRCERDIPRRILATSQPTSCFEPYRRGSGCRLHWRLRPICSTVIAMLEELYPHPAS